MVRVTTTADASIQLTMGQALLCTNSSHPPELSSEVIAITAPFYRGGNQGCEG